jgi:hypothetical protein
MSSLPLKVLPWNAFGSELWHEPRGEKCQSHQTGHRLEKTRLRCLVIGIGSATNSVARLGTISGQRYSSAAPFESPSPPSNPSTGEFALKIFDLFGITVAATAGLCGAALVFTPDAAAAPLPLGGPGCTQQMAGIAAPVADAAPPVPLALPGPPVAAGAPFPAAAPPFPAPAAAPPIPPLPAGLPVGAPVLAGVPAGAPVVAGVPDTVPAVAPLLQQAGGKGAPTNPGPSLTNMPVVLPGPPPPPTPPSPAPVARPTLVSAFGPAPPCCNP